MTRKRYKRLLYAVATLRNSFEEIPPVPGETNKQYGIYFNRKKTAGLGVSEQFIKTLGFVEETLIMAERNGMVK